MSFFTDKAQGGGDYVKLKNPGDQVTMTITGPGRLRYEMYMGQLKTTKKGAKVVGSVIPVEVDGQEMQFPDNGTWRLQKAIGEALMRVGAKDMQVGGQLFVKMTGMDGNAKTYEASYTAPEDTSAEFVMANAEPPTEDSPNQAQGAFAPQGQQPQQGFQQQPQQGFQQQPQQGFQGQPQQGFGQQQGQPQQGFQGQPQQGFAPQPQQSFAPQQGQQDFGNPPAAQQQDYVWG